MKGVAYRVMSFTENGRIDTKGAIKVVFENAGETLINIGPDDGTPPAIAIPAALEQNFNPHRPIDAGDGNFIINQNWKVEFSGEGTNNLLVIIAYAEELTSDQLIKLIELTPKG